MERYLGLDVHAASCTLAVISEKGRRLKDFPVETNGQYSATDADVDRAVFEETCLHDRDFTILRDFGPFRGPRRYFEPVSEKPLEPLISRW